MGMLLAKFHDFATTIRRAKKEDFYGTILAFDPGETTGWALLRRSKDDTELMHAGQVKTWPLREGLGNITILYNTFEPVKMVFESYHIYSWKANQHKNSEVATIQIIGMIQTLALQQKISYTAQTAQVGKTFCTDDKLESWGLWIPGLRHARDAIRHACYYALFGEANTNL